MISFGANMELCLFVCNNKFNRRNVSKIELGRIHKRLLTCEPIEDDPGWINAPLVPFQQLNRNVPFYEAVKKKPLLFDK